MMTTVKTPAEIKAMRESGRMLATVLEYLRNQVAIGMTTKHLSDLAASELKVLGGKPSFLGYQGFPDVICISLNNEVVHGIPTTSRVIADGDIVSLDFGVTYDGMITDSAISIIVGTPRQKRHVELVRDTEVSMLEGIAVIRDQVRTGDIGAAVQKVLDKGKYGIVQDLVGHGVGHSLHEDPNIPNYGRPHTGPWLNAGMTIAIEPMATLGTHEVKIAPDRWTILTVDGSWSAHFEHSVLITDDGAEILTEL
jgi:methionyl aminopeptidase